VKDYVAAGGVKPFKSPERPKRLDGLEGWLRERLIRHRGNADVVRQDLLAEKGVAVSRRTLQRAVQPYRQALKAEALATTRFETPPGRQLQIDFGERLVEIGGAKVKAFVFVATLGHSRRLHVRAFRAERQEHWFAGLESTFTTFSGVPEEVLMDNPRALVVRHDAVSRSVQFNDKLIAFAKHWGFRPRACAPYRARTKGKTENGVGYVKKNAIAGHSFPSWEAFEAHLDRWEREVANVRIHGTTGEAPIIRFARDEIHRLKPLGGQRAWRSLVADRGLDGFAADDPLQTHVPHQSRHRATGTAVLLSPHQVTLCDDHRPNKSRTEMFLSSIACNQAPNRLNCHCALTTKRPPAR
jgi:transposase